MSTSTTAASLPAAAVTMLRVYCSWPGASAMMNLRCLRGEVAVGHVDGDALLALGLQAVGQQRQVDRRAGGLLLQRVELVGEDGAAVEQQPADQRALAVVDAAGGEEAQGSVVLDWGLVVLIRNSLPSCAAPSRRREVRSSMRVAPRSLTVTFSVSATISVALAAGLSTGQVQVMSPTVRKRTSAVSTVSPASRRRHLGQRHQQALAADHLAVVREVQVRQRDVLARDVQPHVELGPVADREGAHVLARADARVEQRPQLGALLLRLPLAEAVAVAEDALLGARLLLVAPRAAHQHVEAVFLDRFEQRHGLVAVARFERVRQAHRAALDRVFQVADDEALAHLGHAPVAELDHLGEVVAGVHVQQREGQAALVLAVACPCS